MGVNQVQAPCERCGKTVRAGEGISEKENGVWKTIHIVCPDNTSLPQNHKERFEQDFARIFS